MKYNPGDKVRFLNEVGGGVVMRVDENGNYLVKTPDGFEIPMPASELLLDRPLEKAIAEQAPKQGKQIVEVPASKPKPSPYTQLRRHATEGVALLLGFEPINHHDPTGGGFILHVINASPFSCYVTVAITERGSLRTRMAGRIPPSSARKGFSIPQEQLTDYERLHVQALYYSDMPHKPIPVEEGEVKVALTRFARPGSFQENPYLNVPLLLVSVRDSQREMLLESLVQGRIEEAIADREADKPTPRKPKEMPSEEVVIDLHFSALSESETNAPAEEILEFQLRQFRTAMDEALANLQIKRLVAIHGVGQGKLRAAVIDSLRKEYAQCDFQDASFKEYGYGATLIFLRRRGK